MEKFNVYSLRENKTFIQEELEQTFSTLEAAKAYADELFEGLTRHDQKRARYEVRSDTDIDYFIDFEISELRKEIERLENDIERGDELLEDWAEWLSEKKQMLNKQHY